MSKLTEKQAVKLYNSKFWIDMTLKERAEFQLFEPLLCMPFDIFHEAIEKTLGRPVYTHEFGLNVDGLRKELMEGKRAPTFEEIIKLIPKEKRVIIL